MKLLFIVALLSSSVMLSGCGQKLQGFSGKVNYDGKPLPEGAITFIPDAGKGNLMGASNIAPIKEGQYNLPVSQGISGGWYKVTVESTKLIQDGNEGVREILNFPPYQFSHEFKPDETVFDIEIPAQKKKETK